MKVKFLGTSASPEAITLRGVLFAVGKAVILTDPDLFDKVRALDYFEEVKRGRPAKGKKSDQNDD